jgi:murein DD-endopeptidase MepM/ murein hydrolase activator NlpD
VYVGDTVSVGEIIGSVGDTALCETNEVAHLHFAMSLDGAGVDPADYLPIG